MYNIFLQLLTQFVYLILLFFLVHIVFLRLVLLILCAHRVFHEKTVLSVEHSIKK